MHRLRLLPAVAAALPREHRPGVAGCRGVPPGLVETAVAVEQERPGQLREAQNEERKHKQLVPEHVTPIGLSVQAPGGDAHVEADGILRDRLQNVEGVKVGELGQIVVSAQADGAPAPQVAPGQGVAAKQFVEAPGHAAGPLPRLREGLADGHVPGREHGGDLLDDDLFPGSHISTKCCST